MCFTSFLFWGYWVGQEFTTQTTFIDYCLNVVNTIWKNSFSFKQFIHSSLLCSQMTAFGAFLPQRSFLQKLPLICWICWWLESPSFPSAYSTYISPQRICWIISFCTFEVQSTVLMFRQIVGHFSGEDLKDSACASTSESHQQSQRTQSQAPLSLFDTSIMWSSPDINDCEDLGKGATVLVIFRNKVERSHKSGSCESIRPLCKHILRVYLDIIDVWRWYNVTDNKENLTLTETLNFW